jgi:hypothetical protein
MPGYRPRNPGRSPVPLGLEPARFGAREVRGTSPDPTAPVVRCRTHLPRGMGNIDPFRVSVRETLIERGGSTAPMAALPHSSLPRPRSTLLGLIVFALLVSAIPTAHADSPLSDAVTGHPAVPPPQRWNSGSDSWTNTTITSFNGSSVYDSYYEYSLSATATNTTNSTVEIETIQTSMSNVTELTCDPRCTGPGSSSVDYVTSRVAETLFENFSTDAPLLTNGTATLGLGVLDAQEYLAGDSFQHVAERTATGVNLSGSEWGTTNGSDTFVFLGPLGLIPWNASTTPTWNGTSRLNLTSTFDQQFNDSGVYANGTNIGDGDGDGTGNPEVPRASTEGSSLVNPGTSRRIIAATSSATADRSPGESDTLGGNIGIPVFCDGANGSSIGTTGSGIGGLENPWINVSCSAPFTGVENVSGSSYESADFNGSELFLGVAGPYLPGPALTEVLPGSDLFGGAATGWSYIDDFSESSGGGSGLVGAGTPTNGSTVPPPASTTPPPPSTAPSHPSPPSAARLGLAEAIGTTGFVLLGVLVLGGSGGAIYLVRRRRHRRTVDPEGPGSDPPG